MHNRIVKNTSRLLAVFLIVVIVIFALLVRY